MGWKAVQESLAGKDNESDDVSQNEEVQMFPNILKGQDVTVKMCEVVPKKTTPPKLHTEATLLTAMENAGAAIENGAILKGKGIGTQATRAEIIKKLFDTEVVRVFKKGRTNYIEPTEKGLNIIRVLPKELYSPNITAEWETKISRIAEGEETEEGFMKSFISFIEEKVEEVKSSDGSVSFRKERESFASCPWCDGKVYRYQKKDAKNKVESSSFYCSNKCGFDINTANKIFVDRTEKQITEAEAIRLISKKSIVLDCKKKDGSGTYKGKFTFKLREVDGGRSFCNILCEPVKTK